MINTQVKETKNDKAIRLHGEWRSDACKDELWTTVNAYDLAFRALKTNEELLKVLVDIHNAYFRGQHDTLKELVLKSKHIINKAEGRIK